MVARWAQNLDMYRRVPGDLMEGTKRGGLFSTMCLISMALLIFWETKAFLLDMNLLTDLKLDVQDDDDSKLIRINFNITLPDLQCDYVTVDATSYLGTQQNITQHITKYSLTEEGLRGRFLGRNKNQKDIITKDESIDESHEKMLRNGEDVLILHPDDFDDILEQNRYVFVDFYANWCSHCRDLLPTWERLAEVMSHVDAELYAAEEEYPDHNMSREKFDEATRKVRDKRMTMDGAHFYEEPELKLPPAGSTGAPKVGRGGGGTKNNINTGSDVNKPKTASKKKLASQKNVSNEPKRGASAMQQKDKNISNERSSEYHDDHLDNIMVDIIDKHNKEEGDLSAMQKKNNGSQQKQKQNEKNIPDEHNSEYHDDHLDNVMLDIIDEHKKEEGDLDKYPPLKDHRDGDLSGTTAKPDGGVVKNTPSRRRLSLEYTGDQERYFPDEYEGDDGELYFEKEDWFNMPVVVAKIDCVHYPDFCMEHGIMAYPTIRLYVDGEPMPADYRGDRTVVAFTHYLATVELEVEKAAGLLERADQVSRALVKQKNNPDLEHQLMRTANRKREREWMINEEPGCQVAGFLLVDRTPGNFNLLARSLHHDIEPTTTNVSHVVHNLSFGEPKNRYLMDKSKFVPDDLYGRINPMQENVYINEKLHEAWHHYMKVVPTKFYGIKLSRGLINAYQIQHSSQLTLYSAAETPVARFMYDLSPISVTYRPETRRWYDFLTSLFAIVGGTFTVFGMFDASTETLAKKLA